MDQILKQPPRTVFKIHAESLTYEQIQHAIAQNNTNRFLRGIVSTCQANPHKVVVVVYKAFSESVLLVFGVKPHAIIIDGTKIKKNLEEYSEKNYIYIFTHSK